jgi:WD40 repeat protein
VTIRLEANPKSEAAETEGAPSHQAPVKGIAKGGMTAKPIAHREDFLPPARMLSARTGVNPFAGSQPAPGGWAPPEPRAHDATRFADIPRPELPGGGPLWTRNHHPGLLGVLDGHDEPIHDLRVSPSGTTYITASEDGHIKNWSARTGVVTKSLRASGSLLLSAEWSEDWRMLALFSCTGDRCSVDVRDMESGGSFQQIATDRAQLGSVALSPNTTLAAIGMDNGTVEVLTLGTSHKLSWKAHKGGVWTTDFDPYGRYLATGGMDHAVRLWEPRTGRQLNSLGGHRGAVHSVRFAPNGLYLASAGADSKILLFRASTGEVVRQFHGHQGTIRALAFDPTGRRLASAGKGTIRIWDMASGEELQSIGWDFGVTALCFDRDGKSLLAGDVVGLVTVWDTRIGSRDTRGRTALWD